MSKRNTKPQNFQGFRKYMYIPLSICTRTVFVLALLGWQVYWPLSAGWARCTRRYDVVTSPFSVITDTPPLGLSQLITYIGQTGEKEKNEKRGGKKNGTRRYRKFCWTNFYRQISFKRETRLRMSGNHCASSLFYRLLLSTYFHPVFFPSDERIYFVGKPNFPKFVYPRLMESPFFP